MIISTLIGALLGVLGAGWYAYDRQAQIYAQLVGILEADRDHARKEAQVFRGLLFPALGKIERNEVSVEAPATPAQPADAGSRPQSAPRSSNPLLNKRTPFKIRFKKGLAMLNTKQQGRNELTAAIQKQVDALQMKEATHA